MIMTDVVGFENFLQSNKDKIDPELLAAKICGRWRNGVPLALSPDTDNPPAGLHLKQMNDYEYVNADGSGDLKGLRCPVGAHMRRINPRGQPVTGRMHPEAATILTGSFVVACPTGQNTIRRNSMTALSVGFSAISSTPVLRTNMSSYWGTG